MCYIINLARDRFSVSVHGMSWILLARTLTQFQLIRHRAETSAFASLKMGRWWTD